MRPAGRWDFAARVGSRCSLAGGWVIVSMGTFSEMGYAAPVAHGASIKLPNNEHETFAGLIHRRANHRGERSDRTPAHFCRRIPVLLGARENSGGIARRAAEGRGRTWLRLPDYHKLFGEGRRELPKAHSNLFSWARRSSDRHQNSGFKPGYRIYGCVFPDQPGIAEGNMSHFFGRLGRKIRFRLRQYTQRPAVSVCVREVSGAEVGIKIPSAMGPLTASGINAVIITGR